MARQKTWINIFSEFVRDNPRTSAMIAFNLGVWAGQATRKSLGRTDLTDLPSKLVDMVPSMREIGGYVPALPSPLKRKASRRRARKPAARRATKRRSTKRRAA